MRLKAEELVLFKTAIAERISDFQLYLFGSRTDDNAKGGDIDLLIRAQRRLSLVEKAQIRSAYFRKFGERKIDLISVDYNHQDPFTVHILETAILL